MNSNLPNQNRRDQIEVPGLLLDPGGLFEKLQDFAGDQAERIGLKRLPFKAVDPLRWVAQHAPDQYHIGIFPPTAGVSGRLKD